MNETNFLKQLFSIFFNELTLIKRIILLGTLFSLLIFLVPNKYDSTGQLVVISKKVSQSGGGALYKDTDRYITPSVIDMETESNIIRSASVMMKAVEKFVQTDEYKNSKKSPIKTFIKESLPFLSSSEKKEVNIKQVTEGFMVNVGVVSVPGSNVISVSHRSQDPKYSEKFIDILMQEYVDARGELMLNSLSDNYFLKKKTSYKEKLQDLQNSKLSVLKKIDTSDPDAQLAIMLKNINDERSGINQLLDDYYRKQSTVEFLQKELVKLRNQPLSKFSFGYSFSVNSNEQPYSDSTLDSQYAIVSDLATQYHQVEKNYLPGSIQREEIKNKLIFEKNKFIRLVEKRISERKADADTAQLILNNKIEREESLKNYADDIKNLLTEYKLLDIEFNALREAYYAYTQRYEESRADRISNMGGMSNVKVLSWTTTPSSPGFPNRLVIIVFGVITSILLALTSAFLRAYFSQTIQQPHQVEHELGLPILAVFDQEGGKGIQASEPKTKWQKLKAIIWD